MRMSVCLTQPNNIAVMAIVSEILGPGVDKAGRWAIILLVSLAGADCIAKR